MRRGASLQSTTIRDDSHPIAIAVDAAAGDWFSVIVRRNRVPLMISNPIYVVAAPAQPRS